MEHRDCTRRGLLTAALAAAGSAAACSGGSTQDGRPARRAASAEPSSSGSAGPGPRRADWQRLVRSVDGRLARPGEASYDSVRLLQNPRYDGAHPLAVLSVASAADVATGIRFAQDHGVPVALRSGGHSYPGWSAGDGHGVPRSLVLDCRPLDRVSLRSDGTARVGAGAALAPVYDALGRRGRAVAAGSCATVGIAGLTLGGGVGVLTRDLGLTCDAVTGLEVVTADGRVRTVDADHDPDLFWALRGGGGGHLGMVTAFRLRTSPAPSIRTFYLRWPLSAAPQVLEAWQGWAPSADARLWSTAKVLGGAAHPDGPVAVVAGTWTGPAVALDAHLRGLLDHVPPPAVDSGGGGGYREVMMSYAGCVDLPIERCTTGPGGALERERFAATSHVAYDPLPAPGVDELVSRVDSVPTGLREAGASLDALGGAVADVAPDETAFVHRRALATVQYTATYDSGPAGPAERFVRGLRDALTPWWGNHAYVNYADAALDDPRHAYFGANAARLRQVDRDHDPGGFFSQPQGL